ncbi:MAG: GNAT family N-acetyltransferase [Woeseiaceae bacterium]
MQPAPSVSIETASPEDAAALSQFAADIFRTSFADDNSAENMNLYLRRNFSESIQAAQIADPNVEIKIVRQDDAIVGYLQLAHQEPPPITKTMPSSCQLWRIYVAAHLQGSGIGKRLIETAAELARGKAEELWLAVWDQNTDAIRFYLRLGFRDIGVTEFHLGDEVQYDRVLSLTL